MRKFSSYGPVDKDLHFFAPRKELIEKWIQLIGDNPIISAQKLTKGPSEIFSATAETKWIILMFLRYGPSAWKRATTSSCRARRLADVPWTSATSSAAARLPPSPLRAWRTRRDSRRTPRSALFSRLRIETCPRRTFKGASEDSRCHFYLDLSS